LPLTIYQLLLKEMFFKPEHTLYYSNSSN